MDKLTEVHFLLYSRLRLLQKLLVSRAPITPTAKESHIEEVEEFNWLDLSKISPQLVDEARRLSLTLTIAGQLLISATLRKLFVSKERGHDRSLHREG